MILYENEISEYVKTTKSITSAWYGGSKATLREDSLSDIDLVLITSDSKQTFHELETFLHELAGIELTHVEKKRPNYNQRFYILKNTPTTYYLDVCVFESKEEESYAEYFNEKRHGRPLIIKDDGLLLKASKIKSTSQVELESELLRGRSEIYYRTFLKESLREKYIDAHYFYSGLLQVYVCVLRRKYSPEKHDFNMRYIYVDLHEKHAEKIEQFLKVSTLEEMIDCAQEIKTLIREELV